MNFSRALVATLTMLVAAPCAAQGILPSWNDWPAKIAIDYPPMQASASMNLDAVKKRIAAAMAAQGM
jgi:hypothetical protein